jgi:hypothetical protein
MATPKVLKILSGNFWPLTLVGESTVVVAGLGAHHPEAAGLAGQEKDELLLGDMLVDGPVSQHPRHPVLPHPVALVVVGPSRARDPAHAQSSIYLSAFALVQRLKKMLSFVQLFYLVFETKYFSLVCHGHS